MSSLISREKLIEEITKAIKTQGTGVFKAGLVCAKRIAQSLPSVENSNQKTQKSNSDLIYRTDAIKVVRSVCDTESPIDCFSGEISPIDVEIIDELEALPSAEATAEEVWSVAQKVFHSTLTYREAVDYVKEMEKQHERFNQQNRCD